MNIITYLYQNTESLIIIIFLFTTLLIGIISGKKVQNFQEYAIGKRNLPTVVIGMTLCATLIGSGSSLGTSTEVFKFGIIVMVAKYGVSIGALVTGFFIVPRMHRFLGMLTVGEIMEKLYGKEVRIITGISGTLLCLGRVTAQVMGIGFVMNYILGVPKEISVLLGAFVIVIYSTWGGIRSVAFTDVLQFIALIVTIPIVLNIALTHIGGYASLFSKLPSSKLTIYPNNEMFIKYLIVFFYMSMPMLTPPLVQRVLMSKSIDQAKKSFIMLGCTDIVFTTISGFIGLIAYTINSTSEANLVFLNLVNELSNISVGLKVIAIIGLLSVIMSTADSYLNTTGLSLVHDVCLPLKLINFKQYELYWTRAMIFILGVLSAIISLFFENIFDLAIYFANFWGPIIMSPMILGIFNIKVTKNACLLSMLGGLCTFLLWEFFQLKSLLNVYSIIPAVFVNLGISLFFIYTNRINNASSSR